MKEISKEKYIEICKDYEKLYLITILADKVYLRSDIEYGGELQIPRIEIMDFEVNTLLPFSEACVECRGNYVGGINYIEYDSEKMANENALNDFLKLEPKAIFVVCRNNELIDIARVFNEISIYIIVE